MLKKLLFILPLAAGIAPLPASASPIWKAQKQAVYEPNESGNDLIFSFDAFYVYNSDGQPEQATIIDSEGTKQRTLTTYTDGRATRELTEELVGDEWKPVKLRERTYDAQTGIITSNVETYYVNGKEMAGNCYQRQIRRTPAGTVGEITLSVLFQGRYDAIQRIRINSNSITVSDLQYATSSWVTSEEYTDIVWERTDGQIVSVSDLFTGSNRIASAHYVNSNGNEPYYDYDIAATYGEGNDFECKLTGLYQGLADAEVIRNYSEAVAADGSATYTMTTSYDVADSEEPAELYCEQLQVDAWGLETRYVETAWLEGEEPQTEVERITNVTYDSEAGYPLQAVAYENGTPISRVDFSDYVDCSQLGSLRDIQAESGSKQLFDLSGRRVADSYRGFKISKYGVEAPSRPIR